MTSAFLVEMLIPPITSIIIIDNSTIILNLPLKGQSAMTSSPRMISFKRLAECFLYITVQAIAAPMNP